MKLDGDQLLKRFKKAQSARSNWEDMWQDVYDYCLPAREGFYMTVPGEERTDMIYDQTALVALFEFVSRMQQGTIPAHQTWWRFEPGPEITDPRQRRSLQAELDEVTSFIWDTVLNSNFANESQESLADLAVGWSTMTVNDGVDGKLLSFKTIPQSHVYWDTGPFKDVDGVFRIRESVKIHDLKTMFGMDAKISQDLAGKAKSNPDATTDLIEACYRDWKDLSKPRYYYQVLAVEDKSFVIDTEEEGLGSRPYVTPRWTVAAGECYGRGPLVMALPAIRTVNLVQEMILEHGQMAISGLWQIDDDGTIAIDNVEIVPGAVYARPPDSRGLERTDAAGNFNIGDIVIQQQQDAIRQALFAQNFGSLEKTPRSALEVEARIQNLAEQVAGPSARIKAEMTDPLLQRIVYRLTRAGKIEMPRVDGREVRIIAKSPLARAQRFDDIERIRGFAGDVISILGPQASQLYINQDGVIAELQEKWEVPERIVRPEDERQEMANQIAEAATEAQPESGGALPAQATIQ